MGRKLTAVSLGGGAPHLTQSGQDRGLPACQVSSGSVQPFGHNTPTLQSGQDRTDRTQTSIQRSDSIGRTVLQMVAKKTKARFSRLLRHPAWKRIGPILVSAFHKFVTYLLTYLDTYRLTYSSGTHTGRRKCRYVCY